ncbi:MAG TPA: AAA family ATPase [Solirubrobacteraceae bacterium]|nr:AAA family ATPase [Solirubrobacteraceae bacterium]
MTAFDAEVTIRRTRFSNAENGFAVVDADGADGEHIVLVGPLIHLEERERARILGSWVEDRRYGPQVKVSEAHPLPPAEGPALEAYLRRVKHVGRKRAQALVDRHGSDRVLDEIDRDPAAAFRAVGLSYARAAEAAASWHALRVTRQLHLLLAPHGLSYLVARIHEEYGATAHRVLSTNPYELTRVFGVGFAIADRIALATGCARENPGRARAALIHLLSESERSGNTCLPLAHLLPAARELLGEPCDLGEADVDELVTSGDLTRDGDWIYRAATAGLEEELAERVRGMLSSARSARLKELEPDGVAGGAGLGHGTTAEPVLTDEQLTGVEAAFAHRLSVITGGPGTGKTATIRMIAAQAARQNARVMLVAPTGRAASRMSEASGLTATTVHSALGWIPGEGPTHDEDDPVKCDLLIVDESSMANLELMVTLLRAVPATAHVVLVGDADQLAPVGAGKPFAELTGAGLVPTARLTHIFRQAAGSMIVQGAHAIRRGEAPEFSPGEGMRRDLFLIERMDPIAARAEIVSLVTERLPAHYGVDPVTDIQVFAPVYRGELGIDALNEALREALNPDGRKVGGGRLRIGDKLMMTGRNLHELRLMNGTLLRLIDEVDGEEGDDRALLLAGEEGVFRLPPEESERLRLAYACSVHRGQGIELPVAVIVAHPAAGAYFLRREMLYTAITRARLATVIVGLREVVARAARTPDTSRRHCRLADRLGAG